MISSDTFPILLKVMPSSDDSTSSKAFARAVDARSKSFDDALAIDMDRTPFIGDLDASISEASMSPPVLVAGRAKGSESSVQEAAERYFQCPVAVYDNPPVTAAFMNNCFHSVPDGGIDDILILLHHQALLARGGTGEGVYVAVIDTGIDRALLQTRLGYDPIAAEYSKDVVAPRGNANTAVPRDFSAKTPRSHGTMVAYLVSRVVPQAKVIDIKIFEDPRRGTLNTFASDLIGGFTEARRAARAITAADPACRVVINSSTQIHARPSLPGLKPMLSSKHHPLYQEGALAHTIDVDVVMPAGNCEYNLCSQGSCTAPHKRRVSGLNGHPHVLTVGGVSKQKVPVGYSLEGPATAESNVKPDVSCYCHFTAWADGVSVVARGTSFASPLVAGVLAGFRSKSFKGAVPSVPSDLNHQVRSTAQRTRSANPSVRQSPGILDVGALLARFK